MRVYVLYQDVSGGVKTATEAIIRELGKTSLSLKSYKQPSHFYVGPFAYTRWFFGSVFDCVAWLNVQRRPDWVYVTSLVPAVAHLFSRHRSVKLYYHFHGDQRLFITQDQRAKGLYGVLLSIIINGLQKYALIRADKIGFVSLFAQKQCVGLYPRLSNKEKNFCIVPNGVDVSRFHPLSGRMRKTVRGKYGFSVQDKIVVCVARMDKAKRSETLLAAFDKLRLKNKRLVFVYPEDMDQYSRQQLVRIQKHTLHMHPTHSVHFYSSPDHIEELYQLADCCVLLSKNESFSLVALESLASGTPFFGCPVGNIDSLINSVDKRLLLPAGSTEEVCGALSWFFSLSDERRRVLREKSVEATRAYGWDRSAAMLYENLL